MSSNLKRYTITFFKVFNTIGLIIVIATTFIILNHIATQAKVNHDDLQHSTTRIESDLNCLGHFYSQRNRANLTINNLETCTILNTSTGERTILSSNEVPVPIKTATKTPTTTSPKQPIVVPQEATTQNPSATSQTTSAPPDPKPSAATQILKGVNQAIKPISNLLTGAAL
jgi:hypothetical protein